MGGGIRGLDDMHDVLLAGAEKVSVNSLAVRDPQIIAEGARAFGSQCIQVWRFDLGMVQGGQTLGTPLIGGDKQYIHNG